jgi:hypothetical protein
MAAHSSNSQAGGRDWVGGDVGQTDRTAQHSLRQCWHGRICSARSNHSFARTFTTDLKDRKIRVNAVSPGVIPSPGYRNSLGMTEEQIKQYADSVVDKIPLSRTGTLDEVARVVFPRFRPK